MSTPFPRPPSNVAWTQRIMAALLLATVALLFGPGMPAVRAATFIVNANDDTVDPAGCDADHCSLREAITAANLLAGADLITFALAPGATRITLTSALPVITSPVTIDGTSQAGFVPGAPVVELAGGGFDGLSVGTAGSGTVIASLVLNGFDNGVVLTSASGMTIKDSFIGTDVTGTVQVANGIGINVFGGSSNVITGNVVSGNQNIGILIEGSTSNTVQGNVVGLDKTGTAVMGNGSDGILLDEGATSNLIGGSTGATTRNIISGNAGVGVSINGSDSARILGNYIGTDASGTVAFGNNGGVVARSAIGEAIGGAAAGEGNLISGNFADGVKGDVAGVTVQGNRIGTDASGTAALGNEGDGVNVSGGSGLIGGTAAGAGNLISGNGGNGVTASTDSLLIQGNRIGTDTSGTAALANGENGIDLGEAADMVVGGSGAGAGNVISGNTGHGIYINGCPPEGSGSNSGVRVQGNRVGVAASGPSLVPNGGDGLAVTGCTTGGVIGGSGAGEGNTVAGNRLTGVVITSAFTSVSILGNRIYDNAGLGIDLGEDLVTANDPGDADGGPNLLQNYPALTSALTDGATGTVSGDLSSTASSTFTVEIFASRACDASGYGEGERPIGTGTVTTNAGGFGSFSFTGLPLAPGDQVTSTATDSTGNTSEFSGCVPALAATTLTTSATPTATVGTPITDTATLAGGTSPTGTITFTVHPPADSVCISPLFTSTVPVSGNGTYTSAPFTPATPATYRWKASYSGDVDDAAADSPCDAPGESSVVSAAVPTLTTTATATVTIGSSITDTASLAGGFTPGGTLTFRVFGPNDAGCAGPPVFVSTVAVAGNGTYSPSSTFTPSVVGAYRWVADYSGDANNDPVTAPCNAANETSTVSPAIPTITTSATPTAPLGSPISDSATVSGGLAPTGTVTFTAFGPNNATCAGAPVFTSAAAPLVGGAAASGPFTPTAAGTYRWVAVYSGDADNASVTAPCNAPSESSVVAPSAPTLTTVASGPATVGGTISDTASLSGGTAPTGAITFTLFGPSDAACAGPPVFTSSKTVAGNGTYTSDPFTANTVGTYRWVAAYSGDADNTAAPTACNDPGESSVVVPSAPVLSTSATPSVTLGAPISDAATLSGGFNPTGTITFTASVVVGGVCQAQLFSSVVPVSGNGTYSSGPFTPTAAGTYGWQADYSGDANNAAASSACAAPGETSVVNPVTPSLSTSATPSVVLGQPISDAATLGGGVSPTGTITFNVYGPDDATCAGSPVFTSTASVDGNGAYGSGAFTATTAGTYRWIASYSGDADNTAVTGACGDPDELSVVEVIVPALSTSATATAPVGSPLGDTATLSGGSGPTGTITFRAFGPDDATCSSPPAFTSTAPVVGNGAYSSAPFTPAAAGTYRWVATYSGDPNHGSVAGACNDPGETSVVGTLTPSLSTTASGTGPVGAPVSDTATLSGGFNPTGTITFLLYGVGDATCTGAPVFSSTVPVSGNGAYVSGPFVPLSPGRYRWIASYSGDSNNAPVSGLCGDPSEVVDVSQAQPAIATAATASSPAAQQISDTATLSGGSAPTGSIVFRLFGPGDPSCAGPPAFTSTVAVSGNGSYPSGSFVPTALGTYEWIAAYSGDANNLAVAGACGDPGETTTIGPATPMLKTVAPPRVPVGRPISDVAVMFDAVAPTGTITFSLHGPGDVECAGTPVFVSTVPVSGIGQYRSGSFTPSVTGTYLWVASYSGDANNLPVENPCGELAETTVVDPATPRLTTQASASAPVGGSISDTAFLAGGVNPTGTITFSLHGPADTACSAAPVFVSTVAVNGTGTYPSASFTPTTPGTYRWVATYSGDANHTAVSTPCDDPDETVLVTPGPTIPPTTSPPTTVPPTTVPPTTVPPTTVPPTTVPPTTVPPTTTPPTTSPPTTPPTTGPPTTSPPTTPPTTAPPTTPPTTAPPTTAPPTTAPPTTAPPTTSPPTTSPPTTSPPTTSPPATFPLVTLPPATVPPTTVTPTTAALPFTITGTTAAVPTSVSPTTAVPPTTTPTTSVPPTTTPVPTTISPPTTRPTVPPGLVARSVTGDSSGPPGVGLSLSGAGFGDCDRVYFFLDGGPQLGAAKPDGNGAVRIGGLSIPGQTSPGTHTITASCQRSGANPRSSTTFTVTAAGVHRPGLITAIPQPRDIPTDLRTIAAVAVLALLFVPLVAFPFQLFNSTLEENYNEVRGWFGLRPRSAEEVFAGREIVQLIILVVASGLLYAFLSPDFGLNRTTLITATALSGAVLATGAGFALPTVIIVRERLHEWGKLKVLPGTIATAAMTVGISRLLHFEPGYVYGLIATFMYRRKLSEKTEGRVTALSCLVILALTLAAWFTRVPVSSAAQQPDASVWVIILEVFLGGVFLLGLESLLIDLLPMRFLDGSRVLRWSRAGWAALFGVGLFVLIHVLLVPGSGYVGKTKDYSLLVVIALYVGFALFSLSFWAYFRYRPPREPAAASSTPP